MEGPEESADHRTAMGFSEIAVDHARFPRNFGPMAEFDGHSSVTGSCGDTMDVWIKVEGTAISEASFHTDGCGASVACGSMAIQLAKSRHLAAVPLLRPEDVLLGFGEFPEDSAHCAELAVDALKASCEDFFRAFPMRRIRKKILILSGSGGTGKSTVAIALARRMARSGMRVGILDGDLHNPSILDILDAPSPAGDDRSIGLEPLEIEGMKVCSMSLLETDRDKAILLRGTRKTMVVRRFLREVDWGDLDALVIDTPPGTGDEVQSLARSAGRLEGAILVGSSSRASVRGIRRSLGLCRALEIPVLGLLGNMVAPFNGEVEASDLFEHLARETGVPCLGTIPHRASSTDGDGLELPPGILRILEDSRAASDRPGGAFPHGFRSLRDVASAGKSC